MDADMEFGPVKQTPPHCRRRPDRNRHYAVVPVHHPGDEDLPIFLDLDVWREIESHAQSDTRVELGGVLLGEQCMDENGRPFVMVTDSLRARHYESTKGSFKFTHRTWEGITREREQFCSELQMVGWYHTHPDWGVFLSGRDLFICENFFNRPSDVALVVDPCQGDVGCFQWVPGDPLRSRRTDGFYLTASRFRLPELQACAAQLEFHSEMSDASRLSAGSGGFPIMYTMTRAWQVLAVIGLLGLQLAILTLLAVQMLLPGSVDSPSSRELAAVSDQLEQLAAARQHKAEIDAKLQVLELVLRHGERAPEGVLQSLADQTSLVHELRGSLRAQQSLARELEGKLTDVESARAESRQREEHARTEIARLESKVVQLEQALIASRAALQAAASATDSVRQDADSSWTAAFRSHAKSIGLGAAVGLLVAGATLAFARHARRPADKEAHG